MCKWMDGGYAFEIDEERVEEPLLPTDPVSALSKEDEELGGEEAIEGGWSTGETSCPPARV